MLINSVRITLVNIPLAKSTDVGVLHIINLYLRLFAALNTDRNIRLTKSSLWYLVRR